MTKLIVAAALALMLAAVLMLGGAAHAAEPTGLINTDRKLACKERTDAENLTHFNPAVWKKEGSFQAHLLELVLSGKCALLAKGTKVFISSQGNAGETIAVRVPGETEYRYVDQYTVTVDEQ